jgi:hypothetical protein
MEASGWLSEAVLAGGLLVAGVIGLAGFLKLNQMTTFTAAVADYDLVPRWAVPAVAWLVPLAEIAVCVAMWASSSRRWGAIAVIALLSVFSLAVATNLFRGKRQISCACFGSKRRSLSWTIPIRNSLLAVIVGVTLAIPESSAGQPPISAWVTALLFTATAALAATAIRMHISTRRLFR